MAAPESTRSTGSVEELLMAASRGLRGAWREALEELDGVELAPHDARALLVIGQCAPVRPGVLAERLRIAARSATDVVDRLESQALVLRRPDPNDRRATVVELTPAGTEVLEQVRRVRSEASTRFLSALDPSEHAHLEALLRILTERHPLPRRKAL